MRTRVGWLAGRSADRPASQPGSSRSISRSARNRASTTNERTTDRSAGGPWGKGGNALPPFSPPPLPPLRSLYFSLSLSLRSVIVSVSGRSHTHLRFLALIGIIPRLRDSCEGLLSCTPSLRTFRDLDFLRGDFHLIVLSSDCQTSDRL